jgi:hypothetical protein
VQQCAGVLTKRGGPSGSPMLITVLSCLEMAEPAEHVSTVHRIFRVELQWLRVILCCLKQTKSRRRGEKDGASIGSECTWEAGTYSTDLVVVHAASWQ